jgi:hypothetical protein
VNAPGDLPKNIMSANNNWILIESKLIYIVSSRDNQVQRALYSSHASEVDTKDDF